MLRPVARQPKSNGTVSTRPSHLRVHRPVSSGDLSLRCPLIPPLPQSTHYPVLRLSSYPHLVYRQGTRLLGKFL